MKILSSKGKKKSNILQLESKLDFSNEHVNAKQQGGSTGPQLKDRSTKMSKTLQRPSEHSMKNIVKSLNDKKDKSKGMARTSNSSFFRQNAMLERERKAELDHGMGSKSSIHLSKPSSLAADIFIDNAVNSVDGNFLHNNGLQAMEEPCSISTGTKMLELEEVQNRVLNASREGIANIEKHRTSTLERITKIGVMNTPYLTVRPIKDRKTDFTKGEKNSLDTTNFSNGSLKLPHKSSKGDIVLAEENVVKTLKEQPANYGCDQFVDRGRLPSLSTQRASSPATALPQAALLSQEWVCCDKCEKWRLLPPGIVSAHLPEKWTCKMLYWLQNMNKCTIPEEVTNQLVEPHYDFVHSKQLSTTKSTQVDPNLLEPNSTSNGIKGRRTKLVNKEESLAGRKRKTPSTMSYNLASMRNASTRYHRKTQVEASDDLNTIKIDKKCLNRIEEKKKKVSNGLKQMKTKEKFINGYERCRENCKVYSTPRNKGVGLVGLKNYNHSSGFFALMEADTLKQRAISLQGKGPLTGEALHTYMQAALRLLQAAIFTESGQRDRENNDNKELLSNMYTNAASLFKLCAAAYEHNFELAGAVLAYKCIQAASMQLVDAKQSCILGNLQKLHSLDEKINPEKNLVISADFLPCYEQVMQYVDDTSTAMEALKKLECLITTLKAKSPVSSEVSFGAEKLLALRNVLDFDLHNIRGLIQEVTDTMKKLGC